MAQPDRRAPFGWIPGKDDYRPYRHITDCALYHANVRVTCGRCHRHKVFSGYALWWLFHRKLWDDQLRTVDRRFRCSVCPNRSTVTVAVTRDEATGAQPPMPSERDWKRLVNNQRS